MSDFWLRVVIRPVIETQTRFYTFILGRLFLIDYQIDMREEFCPNRHFLNGNKSFGGDLIPTIVNLELLCVLADSSTPVQMIINEFRF